MVHVIVNLVVGAELAPAMAKAMTFPLSASTTVSFTGPVHLHGWLCHSFSGQTGSGLYLKSRARQETATMTFSAVVSSLMVKNG